MRNAARSRTAIRPLRGKLGPASTASDTSIRDKLHMVQCGSTCRWARALTPETPADGRPHSRIRWPYGAAVITTTNRLRPVSSFSGVVAQPRFGATPDNFEPSLPSCARTRPRPPLVASIGVHPHEFRGVETLIACKGSCVCCGGRPLAALSSPAARGARRGFTGTPFARE